MDDSESVALVCAPPLLLTVTPGATCAVEDVAADVCVVPVDVVVPLGDESALVGVDADEPTEALVPSLGAPTPDVPVVVAAVPDPVLPAEASADVEVEPDVSALANPGEATTITPMPKAAANAPTRPT